jgi:hypothetical protein
MKLRHPLLLLLTLLPVLAAAAPKPLSRAHAHNDYEHPRPLLDALDHGFCSVEADIFLVDGQLLVAHERDKVRPERTLERLYLEPLRQRAKVHDGRIYPGGGEFFLLIDIKSEAEPTYAVLRPLLARYADLLTTYRDGRSEQKAVTAILSGNRPRAALEAERVRHAGLDGRPEDLRGAAPARLVPWISAGWPSLFQWRGEVPMPPAEREKLRQLVAEAHRQGRKVRFWATPELPAFWKELLRADVDLIGTDRLSDLRDFLTEDRS